MGALQLSNLSSLCSTASPHFGHSTTTAATRAQRLLITPLNQVSFPKGRIRATESTVLTEEAAAAAEPEGATPEEPPSIDFAFVSSRLLPDGSPDIQIRSACGGQKLRDIMLDGHIDLYGPYARPLLNCGGGGTCGTCLVEVIEGKELLSPRTEKEKEALKRKPKTWRLACQTVVGAQESRGQVVIQQLPEWKAHDWKK